MTNEGVYKLITEILKQARRDYKQALKLLVLGARGETEDWAINTLLDCETFFNSEYFRLLTFYQVEGQEVIDEIKKEVERETSKKIKKYRYTDKSKERDLRNSIAKMFKF